MFESQLQLSCCQGGQKVPRSAGSQGTPLSSLAASGLYLANQKPRGLTVVPTKYQSTSVYLKEKEEPQMRVPLLIEPASQPS